MGYVVAAALGYLLGSIPAALLVARRHGVDLRRTADGNPGAWNALEQLGARRALPAFLGDGAKGLAAGLAGLALAGWWGGFAGVAGAMLGHAFPLFAGFRGGKAVMAFAGGAFALAPLAAGICLAGCAAVTAAGSFKWGARAGVLALPAVQLATGPVEHVIGTGALMTLIGVLFVLRARPVAGPVAAERGP
jgi:glycerol-3-phosphate acyltransferase PlsY